MSQHIRWQALIALSGILLLLTLLGFLSTRLTTVVLPVPGGAYTEGMVSRPEQINPLFAVSTADRDLAALIFERLVRVDERGQVQPGLASRWEVAPSGGEIRFTLREDVFWHDGIRFSAEDVRYTVAVLQSETYATWNPSTAAFWRNIRVDVEDRFHVRFLLPEELSPFSPFLASSSIPILPAHLLESLPFERLPTATFNRQPVGTGPWQVARIEPRQIVLTPSLLYNRAPQPALDELIFRFYDSHERAIAALADAEVMAVADLQPEDLAAVVALPEVSLLTAPIEGYTAIFINTAQAALDSRDLREGLLRSLDRQGLIDEVLGGQGLVADGFLSPLHWAFNPALPRYTFDLDAAAERFAAAGWVDSDGDGVRDQNGLPLVLTVITAAGDPQIARLAEEIGAQWAEAGVGLTIRPLAAVEFSNAIRLRDYDLVLLRTATGALPPDPDFYPLWHSSQAEPGGQNLTLFRNESADRLLVEARQQLDPEVRAALYAEFQQILADELPALPLYFPIYNLAVRDLVKNVQIGPLVQSADRFRSVPDWFIRTERVLLRTDEPIPAPRER